MGTIENQEKKKTKKSMLFYPKFVIIKLESFTALKTQREKTTTTTTTANKSKKRMRFQTFFILASIIFYSSCKIGEANLWFLSRLLIVDPNRICSKVNRLRSRQVYICKREPTIISQIINGSIESVRECHYQFADRKWNCPTKNKRSMRKLLGKDTRETGFVHAMTSAAIVHKIATGCAQGTIMDCYCDVKAKPYRTLHPNFFICRKLLQ